MRRTLLLAAATLLLLLASVPGPALAQEAPPAHKDPATVEGGFDALVLLASLAGVYGLLADQRYGDARDFLSQFREIALPENLRFIIERYVAVLGELANALDATDASLAHASALIAQGDREAAGTALQEARAWLGPAQVFLEDLRTATEILGRRFGVGQARSGDQLREAYDRVQALLARLQALGARHAEMVQQLEELRQRGTPEALVALEELLVEAQPLYPVLLEWEAPPSGYPGRELTIAGVATAGEGPGLETVLFHLLLDDSLLEEFTAAPSFERTIRLPGGTAEGRHLLALEAVARGPYGGARAERPLEVIRAPSSLSVRWSPRVALLPREVRVSGVAASEFGPLQGARVALAVGRSASQAVTNETGAFAGAVPLPRGGFFVGPGTLRVTVDPAEPWNRPARQGFPVFVVGVVNLGLLLVVVAYAGMAVALPGGLGRFRRAARQVAASAGFQAGSGGAVPGGPLGTAALAAAILDPSSPRFRVVAAYAAAARHLESRSGIRLEPVTTLRTFLAAVREQTNGAFTELTGLAEMALYAAPDTGEAQVARAAELAARVRGV